MEATQETQPLIALTDEEQIEFSIDVPQPGDKTIRCQSCGAETWMHFYFMEDFMSFCLHHGRKSKENLEKAGGILVADYTQEFENSENGR